MINGLKRILGKRIHASASSALLIELTKQPIPSKRIHASASTGLLIETKQPIPTSVYKQDLIATDLVMILLFVCLLCDK